MMINRYIPYKQKLAEFTKLYKKGWSYEQLISYFNVDLSTLRRWKSDLQLTKIVKCPMCKKEHEVKNINRHICDDCRKDKFDSYLPTSIRIIFKRIMQQSMEEAYMIFNAMISEEGENFVRDTLKEIYGEMIDYGKRRT